MVTCNEVIQNFVDHELTKPYLEYPVEIDKAYESVVHWLSSHYIAGFDAKKGGGKPSINNSFPTEEAYKHNTGREFTFLLPSHCMKTYQNYLRIEAEVAERDVSAILGKRSVTIIDVGCGGGTASVALVCLLINYQRYRLNRKLPLTPVTINCLGIEPNHHALPIYAHFLMECAHNARNLLINIRDIHILPGTLPENSAETINWLSNQKRIHCVVLALSNVIRPLSQERDQDNQIRSMFDKLGLTRFLLPNNRGQDIASKEVTTLKAILTQDNVDQVLIPLISAKSGDKHWHTEMNALLTTLRTQLSSMHQIVVGNIQESCLKFVNPSGSYYREYTNHYISKSIPFDGGFAIINNGKYLEDATWQAILAEENLLLAWTRVRNSFGNEMIEDTIEIRLFESNIEERLKRLRSDILSYQWDALNVIKMFNFKTPKGNTKEPRPMSMCRLEDSILATAILQTKAAEYDRKSFVNSYAYKLSQKRGEFLYGSWFHQYKNFLTDARAIARNNPSYHVVQTDLSSYYTNINQLLLLRDIEHSLNLYKSRCEDLTTQLIYRDCGVNKEGNGIPQGHIISGALSNIYLSNVDRSFIGEPHGIHYFRFVDDIILIYPSTLSREFVLNLLDNELSSRGLVRSTTKTSEAINVDDFLKLTEFDQELENLNQEHTQLVGDLYKLNQNYTNLAIGDWWIFIESYQKLLMSIGVYISIPRLSRKLYRNLSWWRRYFGWFSKLELPLVHHIDELNDIINWQFEFYRFNGKPSTGWIYRRENLRKKLAQLLRSNIPLLESNSVIEQKKARSRVKFAIQRLGQLGFEQEATIVAELLLTQPWSLNPRKVCHDLALQGYQNLLFNIFNQLQEYSGIEWSYVKGAVLKSFSNLTVPNDSIIKILCDVLLSDSSTDLEKLMASESLILIQNTGDLK